MQIAIVEDEQSYIDQLRQYIMRYAEERGIVCHTTEFRDGADFLTAYKPNFDVVFMDIEMPFLNGMDAARRLREIDSTVVLVFITSLKQYALAGYEVEALDFLVKPVGYAHFSTMMDRVRSRMKKADDPEIVLTTGHAVHRVRVSDILYIEIAQHYVVYHTINGEIRFWGSLSEEEKRLPMQQFARPSSAFLVNLAHVRKMDGDTILVEDARVAVSRGKKAEFLQSLMRYLNGD